MESAGVTPPLFEDAELRAIAEEARTQPTSELVAAEIGLQECLDIIHAELQRRA